MTSFGATYIINLGGFKSTFKVQSQVYHRLGSLNVEKDREANYLQVYFMGNSIEEAKRRCHLNKNIEFNTEIVIELQEMLYTHNKQI